MPAYPFVTVDVFTDHRFGGNPLAVFPDASGLSDEQMQALAAEFNLSETTFVLPPDNPGHTARVRIFTPRSELPFAGHPTVGTGYVLAQAGRDREGVLRFEVPAGLVEVKVDRDGDGRVSEAIIAAPQPLSLGATLPVDVVAACAGLEAADVLVTGHPPVLASVGMEFVIAEVRETALGRTAPEPLRFRREVADRPELNGRLGLHLYARDGDRVRTRMFAPLAGITEDPATGSANAALAALLLSLTPAEPEGRYAIVQGVEMGRPSLLRAAARRGPDGAIRATIGGGCVPVLRGEAQM